jgi:hypothetical protein
MLIGLVIDESSVVIFYGQAGAVVWMLGTGVAMLVEGGRGR